jgi:hypothetical protein
VTYRDKEAVWLNRYKRDCNQNGKNDNLKRRMLQNGAREVGWYYSDYLISFTCRDYRGLLSMLTWINQYSQKTHQSLKQK